jgi:hypothetical protein
LTTVQEPGTGGQRLIGAITDQAATTYLSIPSFVIISLFPSSFYYLRQSRAQRQVSVYR